MRRSACSPQRDGSSRGFTLLEVMIATAILFGSLGMHLFSITRDRMNVDESKMLVIGTQLARQKMIELEAKVRKDGFGLAEGKEEEGDFEEIGFSKSKWTFWYKIEKIELPSTADIQNAAAGAAGGASATTSGIDSMGGPTPPGGAASSMNMGLMSAVGATDIIKNALAASIRRVTLEVRYKVRGRGAKKISVTAYFTDPKMVDFSTQVGNGPP